MREMWSPLTSTTIFEDDDDEEEEETKANRGHCTTTWID